MRNKVILRYESKIMNDLENNNFCIEHSLDEDYLKPRSIKDVSMMPSYSSLNILNKITEKNHEDEDFDDYKQW